MAKPSSLTNDGDDTFHLKDYNLVSAESNTDKTGKEENNSRLRRTKPEKWLKYVSLIVLVVQNAGQVLLIRYAATRHQEPYIKTVLVFFGEVFKCGAAFLLLIGSHRSIIKALKDIRQHFCYDFFDTVKVSVPALIYTIQNFLLYVSLDNLDAATYMVTYQLKILTTALFTVMMLKRRLSGVQWIALLVLCGGVAIVQISAKQNSKPSSTLENVVNASTTTVSREMVVTFTATATYEHTIREQNPLIGFAAVVTACFLSGFAGIYFEKILKGNDTSIWLRNVQLASLSIPIGIAMIVINNGNEVAEKGLLQGFDATVWCVVGIQAFGGLLVAVVIKYADNILKAFATSFAIIVSSVTAIFIFALYPRLLFVGGAALVIAAVFLYGLFPYKTSAASSAVVTVSGSGDDAKISSRTQHDRPAEELLLRNRASSSSSSIDKSNIVKDTLRNVSVR